MITESDILEFTISCYRKSDRKSDRKGQNNKRKVTVLRWLFVIEITSLNAEQIVDCFDFMDGEKKCFEGLLETDFE